MTQQSGAMSALSRITSSSESAPYSTATILGDLVWTSGALPVSPDGSVPVGFTDQVRLALQNLAGMLAQASADWAGVVKINGYVDDIERLPELNEVYFETFEGFGLPSRTTVEVSRFRNGVHVEFDAVAYRNLADGTLS